MVNINKIILEKKFSKINLAKIALIVFSSLYLIGNFDPFYEGVDSLLYGLTAIELSTNDSYQISNLLLENSGKWEFIPHQWVKTIHNTAIPRSNPGLPFLATLSYSIGGDYGLFYLGPIFTIALLIEELK